MKPATAPEPQTSPMKRPPRRRRAPGSRGVATMRAFQPHALAIQETPPSPFTRILLWSLVAFLLIALIWTWIGRVPIMTTAPGKFLNDAQIKVVQSLNTGAVSKILVKAGDVVRKGAVLVVLDPRVDQEKYLSTEAALRLNRLQRRRNLVELGRSASPVRTLGPVSAAATLEARLAAAQLAAQRSKVSHDRALWQQAVANLDAGEATLRQYEDRLREDTRLSEAAEAVVGEGAVSGKEYTELKDQVIDDEGNLGSQRKKLAELAAAVLSARTQLDKDVETFRADRYQDLETAASKSYDLASQYTQAKQAVAMDLVRAPVNGIVQSMGVVSLGTIVQSGQTIATVEPSVTGNALIVEADLPAQDVGFVKVGQITRIKVTAYPFEQYGSIPGTVIWISPTAEPKSDLSSNPIGESHQPDPAVVSGSPGPDASESDETGPPTLYYRVKIKPLRIWLDAEGLRRPMRSGMTVSVDITTGHRRVLDFFLDPLIKYVNTGMTVR